jgi:SAM-dependent methyltransferase
VTYQETALPQTIDKLLAENPDIDVSAAGALDNLDQYHIGGADAVDKLIATLALRDGDRVLDVGSGFGGPARQIARRGYHVTGLDITPWYVEAARNLTARAGLAELAEFRVGDIAAFRADPPVQAAITMHVQMNVSFKAAWYRDISRSLAPGGRLAVWEVCQPGEASLTWPMPWSLDGSDSHLVPAERLLASISCAGFSVREWSNESDWARDWMTATFQGGPPAGPALPMLLDDGYTRVINYGVALAEGTLEVWRGSFVKTD